VEMLQKKNGHKRPCILKTSLDKKPLIKIDLEHNHIQYQNEIDATKINMKIKTQAKVSKSTPAVIFRSCNGSFRKYF